MQEPRHGIQHRCGLWLRGNLDGSTCEACAGRGGGGTDRGNQQVCGRVPCAIGKKRGASGRKQGHQNRAIFAQKGRRLGQQYLVALFINHGLKRLYSCRIELLCQWRCDMAAARMNKAAARMVFHDQGQQPKGIPRPGNHIEPRRRGDLGSAPADAIGASTRRGRGCDKWRNRVLRGENHRVSLWNRRPQGRNFDQWGDQDRPVGAKPCPKFARESLRCGFGTGQKQGWALIVHGQPRDCALCAPVLPAKAQPCNLSVMTKTLTFLGIESSCDDTAAAVVRATGARAEILASVVAGQTELHADFGGVVPEIAARAHVEKLDHCVEDAMARAGVGFDDLDGVAVTAGPGLIGGVMSGVMCAKGIAAGAGLPLVGVNHLAGHALTPRLTDGLEFPYLMLLVSGGHCQFLIAQGAERFTRLGGTIDDAPGEAFDKTAKLLGLQQPGGPAVETEATKGDERRFAFPRPLLDRPGCDMSFSGLKTALLRARDAEIANEGGLSRQTRADLCAGFQAAVRDVLAEKSRRALAEYMATSPASPAFAVAGGVAANRSIRSALETVAAECGARFLAPPLALCTDNAAMIAWAGIERFRLGHWDGMDLSARPRWPLDQSAPALIGSGKKGAKA